MRINIASTHRFHLLDLARELEKQGHQICFYSYIPSKRCENFGLNKKCCYSLIMLAVPFFVLQKITPHKYHTRLLYLRNIVLDYYVSWFMKPCDIYICLGSVYKHSLQTAKQKFKATTILEWGSKHIIEQLKYFRKLDKYPQYMLKRELADYELADYISIPAIHTKKSFIMHHIPEKKLLVNPYGVDLTQFHPTTFQGNYDIIMVGGWSYEKGCDLLVKVCQEYNYSLLHVGALINLDFPENPNMEHIDPVDQKDLINYYRQARIFVLSSRSEGLALVQAQAIACGLPIVCSKETGGSDLKNSLKDKRWIIEMQKLSVNELNTCIRQALSLAASQKGIRNYAGTSLHQLTWEAYGKRYNDNLFLLGNIYK